MATEPRDGSVSLAGIPWLARMIDKARMEANGEIAEFDLDYPCPMDKRLLEELSIDGDEFQKIVIAASTDDAIVAELRMRNLINA